jgi:hypothetical protein
MASRKQINVLVDEETHQRMLGFSEAHGGMSMGAVVRLALRFLLPPNSSNDVTREDRDVQEGGNAEIAGELDGDSTAEGAREA